MKKMLSSLLIVLILVFTTSMALAEIPKEGSVTDTINLFSTEEKGQLETALSNKKYDYHVLTVDNLYEEDNIEQLSDEVFEDWELRSNDVLILLSVNENNREIFVTTSKGSDLSNHLEEIGYSDFIMNNFKKIAQKESISGGIQHLVNKMDTVLSEPASNTTSTGISEIFVSIVEVFKKILIGLLLVFLGLVSIVVIKKYITLKALKTKKEKSLKHSKMDLADLLFASTNFLEENKKFSKFTGSTKSLSDKLQSNLEHILSTAKEIEERINSTQFSILNVTKDNNVYFDSEIQSLLMVLDDCEEELSKLEKIEKELQQKTTRVNHLLIETETMLQKSILKLEKPLSLIATRLNNLRIYLKEQITSLTNYDPLYISEELDNTEKKLNTIKADILSLEKYDKEVDEIVSSMNTIKEKMLEKIKKEDLSSIESDIFPTFLDLDTIPHSLVENLKTGDVSKIEDIVVNTNEVLHSSLKDIEDIIQVKKKNYENISYIEKELSNKIEEKLTNATEEKISLISSRFHEKHWRTIPSMLKNLFKNIRSIEKNLLYVKFLNETNSYLEAKKSLDSYLDDLKEFKRIENTFLNIDLVLEKELDTITTRFKNNKNSFKNTSFESEKLPKHTYGSLKEKNEILMNSLEEKFKNKPFDLEFLNKEVVHFENSVSSFVSVISKLNLERKRVFDKLDKAEKTYSSVYQKLSSKATTDSFSSVYNSNLKQTKKLLEEGNYSSATSAIELLFNTTKNMENEYRAILAEEERQKQALIRKKDEERRQEKRRQESLRSSYNNNYNNTYSSGYYSSSSSSDSTSGGGGDF